MEEKDSLVLDSVSALQMQLETYDKLIDKLLEKIRLYIKETTEQECVADVESVNAPTRLLKEMYTVRQKFESNNSRLEEIINKIVS